jgi:hypothetical protein
MNKLNRNGIRDTGYGIRELSFIAYSCQINTNVYFLYSGSCIAIHIWIIQLPGIEVRLHLAKLLIKLNFDYLLIAWIYVEKR